MNNIRTGVATLNFKELNIEIDLVNENNTLENNIEIQPIETKIEEVKEVVSIAETCFKPLLEETLRIIKKQP